MALWCLEKMNATSDCFKMLKVLHETAVVFCVHWILRIQLLCYPEAIGETGENVKNSLKQDHGLSNDLRKKTQEQYVQTDSSVWGKCILETAE